MDEHVARAARAYSAAADHYSRPALEFWGPGWGEPLSGVFWDGVREIAPPLHVLESLRAREVATVRTDVVLGRATRE